MLISFTALFVVCSAVSKTCCIMYRFLFHFGYSSRYLAVLLYVARLRAMTGGAGRKRLSCWSRLVDKLFNALGHSKAVKVLPWVAFSVNLIIFCLMISIFPENDATQTIDTQQYSRYKDIYKVCACMYQMYVLLSDLFLPVVFVLLSLAISVQAKAVSEFLRQDKQVLFIFLYGIYTYANVLLIVLVAAEEPQVRFFAVVLFHLAEVWVFSIVIWKKRVHILLVCREKNTRENVTKTAEKKGQMPHKNAALHGSGKFSMSKMVQQRRVCSTKHVSFGSIAHANQTETQSTAQNYKSF